MLHIFSGNIVHLTFEVAKAMCAADAIFKGILDFIKFGNGQTIPAERCLFREGNMASASSLVCLTLQGYLRHFPTCCWDPLMTRQWLRPMHLVGWMASYNLHMAESSGISSFRWLTQNLAQYVFFHIDFWVIWYPPCSLPLEFLAHRIVLHLMHPNKVYAYMVKPQFPKHMDAKNVVCVTFHPIFFFSLGLPPFPLCHHSYLILWLTTPCWHRLYLFISLGQLYLGL